MSNLAKWGWAAWLFGVLDWFTTMAALSAGAIEGNPITAPWIATPWGFLAKTVGAGILIGAIVHWGRYGSPVAYYGIRILAGLGLGVVLANLITIWRI